MSPLMPKSSARGLLSTDSGSGSCLSRTRRRSAGRGAIWDPAGTADEILDGYVLAPLDLAALPPRTAAQPGVGIVEALVIAPAAVADSCPSRGCSANRDQPNQEDAASEVRERECGPSGTSDPGRGSARFTHR